MRFRSALAFATLFLAAGSAHAVPMSLTGTLQIAITGLAPVTIAGSGTVDVSPGSLAIPAGFFLLTGPVTVPITATSAVASLTAAGISNLAGTFTSGGVTNQIPSEVCVTPGSGEACVTGGGLGGQLGLTGAINVAVIPNIVVVPFPLGPSNMGIGGSTSTPFSFDAAPWTTGVALMNTGNSIIGVTGSNSGNTLSLVTTTFVLACGNLLPVTGTLTLSGIVPEPETLLLLVTGVAGLIVTLRGRAD